MGAAAGVGSVKKLNVGLTIMTRVSGPTVTGLTVISGSIANIEQESSDYRRRGRDQNRSTCLRCKQDGYDVPGAAAGVKVTDSCQQESDSRKIYFAIPGEPFQENLDEKPPMADP